MLLNDIILNISVIYRPQFFLNPAYLLLPKRAELFYIMQPPQSKQQIPWVYLKRVFEIASVVSKSPHQMQLHQRVRAHSRMGSFQTR